MLWLCPCKSGERNRLKDDISVIWLMYFRTWPFWILNLAIYVMHKDVIFCFFCFKYFLLLSSSWCWFSRRVYSWTLFFIYNMTKFWMFIRLSYFNGAGMLELYQMRALAWHLLICPKFSLQFLNITQLIISWVRYHKLKLHLDMDYLQARWCLLLLQDWIRRPGMLLMYSGPVLQWCMHIHMTSLETVFSR